MPDTDTDRSDDEFWCGMSSRPEEIDGTPVDEYFEAETPRQGPRQGGPGRNEGFAPVHWVRTVVRKVRTFGSTPGLDGDVFQCLHCGHDGPFPVHTWTEGEPVYECPGCEVTAPENEFDPRDIETAIRIAGSDRSDSEN